MFSSEIVENCSHIVCIILSVSTTIPSTTTVPQTPSSAVITTAVVSPTPTATPEIITETTQTIKGILKKKSL